VSSATSHTPDSNRKHGTFLMRIECSSSRCIPSLSTLSRCRQFAPGQPRPFEPIRYMLRYIRVHDKASCDTIRRIGSMSMTPCVKLSELAYCELKRWTDAVRSAVELTDGSRSDHSNKRSLWAIGRCSGSETGRSLNSGPFFHSPLGARTPNEDEANSFCGVCPAS
jgi:hypothetical protein